jgi:hypothetical protein
MNNTMLILMNDCRLYYYYLNPMNVNSDKDMVGFAIGNINIARKKF